LDYKINLFNDLLIYVVILHVCARAYLLV
jgi:hypothetical protein